MPTTNIFQQPLVPNKPKTLSEERVFVYVPLATNDSPGIASFVQEDFVVNNGVVQLTWPMKEQIESLSDPLVQISRVKLLDNEFEHTGQEASVTNRRGDKYTSRTAEVKFNRKNRNAFTRPDFVMLREHDFEQSVDENSYVTYSIKQNDPFTTPSLVQLNENDFQGSGDKKNIITIKWPYAHRLANGTQSDTNTDGFGIVRISQNPQEKGYLTYTSRGDIIFNTTTLQNEPVVSVKPTYTGGDGFISSDWVDGAGIAKRENGYTKVSITKEAVGLSKVENKSFDEYVYNDFGQDIKDHFDAKLDKSVWDEKFSDWSEPVGTTVQKVFTELREKDASILDTIRTAHQFLGFFEDSTDLENTYSSNQFTFGSLAYVNDTKSYWRVRATNVNKILDRVPTSLDVPDDAKLKDTFRVANRTTGTVYQWNSSTKRFDEHTEITLKWVDAVVANIEDIAKYIAGHAKEHFFDGFLLGCRESGRIQRYVESTDDWEDSGEMYYEWADAYISTFAWNTFVETDASILKPDGIASVGISGKWVNSDHVHPTDQTRLAKSVFDGTIVKVTSEYTGLDTDFVTTKFAGGGEHIVNIPYIRKSIGWHNWQGSPTVFADVENNQKYLWSGTSEQFAAEKDDIQDGSLIFVEGEGEDFITSNLITEDMLRKQGLWVNDDSNDRVITISIDDVDSLTNVPVTLEKYHDDAYQRDSYRLKKIDLGTVANRLIITKSVDSKIVLETLKTENLSNDGGLISYAGNGDILPASLPVRNILRSTNAGHVETLPTNRLLISDSQGPNVVKTFNSGDTEGRVIVSNGLNGIMLQVFDYPGSVLFANSNNVIEETTIHHDNLIISGNELEDDGSLKVQILDHHKLVMTSDLDDNIIESLDTGTIEGKMLIADGLGALKVSDIAANSLMYIGDRAGVPIAFPMTINDYNKVISVGIDGKPTLMTLPTVFDKPYMKTVTSQDWEDKSDYSDGIMANYQIKILANEHLKWVQGGKPIVQVFYTNLESEIMAPMKIESNGDITICSDAKIDIMIVIH